MSLSHQQFHVDTAMITEGDKPAAAAADAAGPRPRGIGSAGASRVFVVNYRFLRAGDVFTAGLRHALEDLRLEGEDAYWDDPRLQDKIAGFRPELLFVVHGRRFAKRAPRLDVSTPSAVWLVDEPYEVDDTASWSSHFGTVFVNDPGTLNRHRNAHYLPGAFDPHVHRANDGPHLHAVGFIGGSNPSREALLLRLLNEALLSYVVGGPWRNRQLERICLARSISPLEAAKLYQQTKIVVNIFRDQHHFNRDAIPGVAANFRIYEALACGALVVSEWRPEVERMFPAAPTFRDGNQLTEHVRSLLADEEERRTLLDGCRKELPRHTYAQRLRHVLRVAGAREAVEDRMRGEPAPDARGSIDDDRATAIMARGRRCAERCGRRRSDPPNAGAT